MLNQPTETSTLKQTVCPRHATSQKANSSTFRFRTRFTPQSAAQSNIPEIFLINVMIDSYMLLKSTSAANYSIGQPINNYQAIK